MICVTKDRTKRLNDIDADTVLLFNRFGSVNPNFFYFTDSDVQGIFVYDMKKPLLLTSEMERQRAKKSRLKIVVVKKTDEMFDFIGRKVAVDGRNMSFLSGKALMKKTRLVDITGKLEEIRAVKDSEELARIKKAAAISGRIFRKISAVGTERSLRADIDYEISSRSDGPAFRTIVASGRNIAIPHHAPSGGKLEKTVLVDFGVRYRGYCSDVARTFGSRYTQLLEKILEELEANIKPGTRTSELDKLARKILGKYSRQFVTSLGHGIGISVHEKPSLSSGSKDILKPGMVIAVEPAVYLRNGARIENDYLVTEDGCKNLTDF